MSTRKQISLTEPVKKRALELITKRELNGLSHLLATLVHEEYDRRFPASEQMRETNSANADQVGKDAEKALESYRAEERKEKRRKKSKTP